MLNFLEVRNNLAHMLHEDPLQIQNPPFEHEGEEFEEGDKEKGYNPSSLSMTNINGIELKWLDEKVLINPENDPSFSITYDDRTEGEISAEVVKIIEHLN